MRYRWLTRQGGNDEAHSHRHAQWGSHAELAYAHYPLRHAEQEQAVEEAPVFILRDLSQVGCKWEVEAGNDLGLVCIAYS